jgi:predicted RNase H-like HicB family nuclease
MKSYVYRVELEEEDGVWSAVIPALPGCAVWVYTVNDAMQAILDVAQVHVELLIEDDRPVPLSDVSTAVSGPFVHVMPNALKWQSFLSTLS